MVACADGRAARLEIHHSQENSECRWEERLIPPGMGSKAGGWAEQCSWDCPLLGGICWVPASYFPHECVAQQHMSHNGRCGKLSSSTCWSRYFTDLKSMDYLTPDCQSGIYKQETGSEIFKLLYPEGINGTS